MRLRPLALKLSVIGIMAALTGCGTGEPEDIRVWMDENSKGLKGKVPELPEIKPLPAITYDPGELVAPFSLEKLLSSGVGPGIAKGGGPKPINPDAYPLTKAPLESLRLIGTMIIGKQPVAIVGSERDAPVQIKVGDYIGQNHGKVVSIRPDTGTNDGEIVVKEQVLDKGVWVERDNRVTLVGQGDKR